MNRKVTVQEFIDALGMAELLVSVNGEKPCKAIMSLYTEPSGQAAADVPVTGITFNSKEAAEGTLFVVKGANFKEQYLEDAIAKGTVCYVRQDPEGRPADMSCSTASPEDAGCDSGIFKAGEAVEVLVSDIRKAMPVVAETFYGKLSDEIKMIGITGTKGKSTTAYFMRHILDDYMESLGKGRSAICSGIDIYDGVTDEAALLTTPEIMELYLHMNNAVKSGISHMTMEVSSQALKYDRVTGIDFEAGAFLNIGSDHISDIEHPDFDDYLESKLKIFGHCRKACYNLDCDEQERIKAASSDCPYVITFSCKDESANIYAYDVKSREGSVTFRARGRGIDGYADFDEEFTPGTFGTINVENALAAISLSALLGVPLESVKRGLEATIVPGRMEMFKSADGRRIALVDFAHNELSFERFYETIKEEFPGWKIISVFGATGTKGVNRRIGMGRMAGRYSDYTIITEDDPGYEDVNAICAQIAQYVAEEGGRYEIVTDRVKAVLRAIELQEDNTLLFLAGRGRDTKMKRGAKYVELPSDADVVMQNLK